MKTILLVGIAALLLSGCAGMSESMQAGTGVGGVESTVSGFDGQAEVVMENAWVANDGGGMARIGMAFRWRSSSPDHVGIIVRVFDLNDYNNIGAAALNIDGNIAELAPVETLTTHDSTQVTNPTCSLALGCTKGISFTNSEKMFVVDLSLVRKMLVAGTLKIRVDSGRDYRVGNIRKDSMGNVDVRDRLPAFVAEVDKALAK